MIRETTKILNKKLAGLGAGLLRNLPPELAHNFAGSFLKKGLIPFKIKPEEIFEGLNLSCQLSPSIPLNHPIGLAAGFDKNAQYLAGLSKLGFSFIEVGAATPLPQMGNPKPRVFRNKKEKALVNRMGFNNLGIERINQEILDFKSIGHSSLPLGLNIGVNKKTPVAEALQDYISVLQQASADISYYSLNLSSPNTESLKHLCHPDLVRKLALSIKEDTKVSLNKIWIKFGPNLEKSFFQSLVEAVSESGFAGLILTNTYPVTLPEKGGLSGKPILSQATKSLEWAWEVHKGSLPMVGVGGIFSGKDVYEKIRRGSSFVQIYTAFVYRGPYVVEYILQEFACLLREKNIKSLKDLQGSFYLEKK